jgi:hypothetical protein
VYVCDAVNVGDAVTVLVHVADIDDDAVALGDADSEIECDGVNVDDVMNVGDGHADTEGVNVADIVLLAVIVCVDDAVKVADACTLWRYIETVTRLDESKMEGVQ